MPVAAIPEVLGAVGGEAGGAAAAEGGGGMMGGLKNFGGQALKYKGASSVMGGGDPGQTGEQKPVAPSPTKEASARYSALLQPGQFH